MENIITAESYTLYYDNGDWLGQIVLTSDGMFASVTDYGNLSFAWRHFGKNFKAFLADLDIQYFATKMYMGNAYINDGRKVEKSCQRYAEKILPALQKVLKAELNQTT